MVNIPLKCPHCESQDAGNFGASAVGKQRYICRNKDCKKRSKRTTLAKATGRKPAPIFIS